jgi:hypothetical protein
MCGEEEKQEEAKISWGKASPRKETKESKRCTLFPEKHVQEKKQEDGETKSTNRRCGFRSVKKEIE